MDHKQRSLRWLFTDYLRADGCELSASARHVGLALAVYWMDDLGRCSPSYGTIVDAAGLAMRSVKRGVKALREDGCVVVTRAGTGRRVPNHYEVNGALVAPLDDGNGARNGARNGAKNGASASHEQGEQVRQVQQALNSSQNAPASTCVHGDDEASCWFCIKERYRRGEITEDAFQELRLAGTNGDKWE